MSTGPSGDQRRHRGEEVPHCAFPHWCRARKHVLALTNDELRLALESAPEPNLSDLVRSLGVQPSSRRTPQLLRARLAKMAPEPLHYVTWMLSASPIGTLSEAIGLEPEDDRADDDRPDDDRPDDDRPDDDWPETLDLAHALREGGLAKWARRWPPAVLRLALEGLWDRSFFDVEVRDGLLALLDSPDRRASAPPTGDSGAPVEVVAEEVRPPGQPAPAEPDAPAAGQLERLLRRAVAGAEEPPATDADRARHRRGIEWLIELAPDVDACWFAYGRLVAADPAGALEPRSRAARLQFLAGRLSGLSQAADHERAADLVTGSEELAAALVEGPGHEDVTATILEGLLPKPRDAARSLETVARPFPGWQRFVERARAEGTALLLAGRGAEAEVLLRVVEERLLRWAATTTGAEDRLISEAGATTVLRAACRRRRGDFLGCGSLLGSVDRSALAAEAKVAAAAEAALALAEIGDVDQLTFPDASDHRLVERLERARPSLTDVVRDDPAHPEANLLLGMLASCRGDDAEAVRYLTMVADGLSEQPQLECLASAVVFHRALSQLRLLEPGTDEGAQAQMAQAIREGYEPSQAQLASAALALEAHGSAHAAGYLARAVASNPSDPMVLDLVSGRARVGDSTARQLAEELAGDVQRRLVDRFDLLEAAIAGAEVAGDTEGAGRLAGMIDDVVVRANRPALDHRWEAMLEESETLRAALDPAHADALRIEVLRRSGRLGEARALATRLFYRAAAGSLRAFDAAELLELLRELGVPQAEIDDLAPLLAAEPLDPGPGTGQEPHRVLFVGGNETQEHYRAWLEADLATRYRGAVEVEWLFSGWTSNWRPVADRIEAGYSTRPPSAVVLMTFVRTNLGRWVRRTAGEHGVPWVACTGHGRDAISRAIDRAVRVAVEARGAAEGDS